MRLLLKTRCRPTGSGPAQSKTQATWRGENRDTLCLPCSLPVTSFTGSQHPALNYCVSWCISLLWLQTFCRVKHGRITITGAPGALLALETFPQEVICHIVFTSYQLRQERRKKEGLYNCTSEHRLGGKKYIFGFGIHLVHSRKHAENPVSSARWFLLLWTVFKSFKKNRLFLIHELNNLLLVSPSMHGRVRLYRSKVNGGVS